MFSQDVTTAIRTAAAEAGIEAAALAAIAELESAGVAYAAFDGRREPLIRFEGHYFDRRLSDEKRAKARAEKLSSPTAGKVANPANQPARWRLLDRAAEIDRNAAWESTSWGLGQIMGAHWAWLGYASVDAFAADARSGALGQARQMARYLAKAGLAGAVVRRDWKAVARGYNGPAFAKNRYDTRLAAAFARHAAVVRVQERDGAMTPEAGEAPVAVTPKHGLFRRFWDVLTG
jgi:hypothetical protein